MFTHINGKLSPRPFEIYGWTKVYLEKLLKYELPLFQFHTQNKKELPRIGISFLSYGTNQNYVKIADIQPCRYM